MPRPCAAHRETNEPLSTLAPSVCAPVKARRETGMIQSRASTRHEPTPCSCLGVRALRGSPRRGLQRCYLAPGRRARQVPDPVLEWAARGPAPARVQEQERERERSSTQEQAPAAPRRVEEASPQEEEWWRAAQRVPGEGWGHSAAGASRVGRRTCRRRRPGCRDGRRARRAPRRRTDRRPRSHLPRRPTHPSGLGARRDASARPGSRPRSRS